MFFHALTHLEIYMIMDLFFQRFGNIKIQIFKYIYCINHSIDFCGSVQIYKIDTIITFGIKRGR